MACCLRAEQALPSHREGTVDSPWSVTLKFCIDERSNVAWYPSAEIVIRSIHGGPRSLSELSLNSIVDLP